MNYLCRRNEAGLPGNAFQLNINPHFLFFFFASLLYEPSVFVLSAFLSAFVTL